MLLSPFERWNKNRILELTEEQQLSRDDKSLIHFPLSLSLFIRIPMELKHTLSQLWSKQNAPEKDIEVCLMFLKTILGRYVPRDTSLSHLQCRVQCAGLCQFASLSAELGLRADFAPTGVSQYSLRGC